MNDKRNYLTWKHHLVVLQTGRKVGKRACFKNLVRNRNTVTNHNRQKLFVFYILPRPFDSGLVSARLIVIGQVECSWNDGLQPEAISRQIAPIFGGTGCTAIANGNSARGIGWITFLLTLAQLGLLLFLFLHG